MTVSGGFGSNESGITDGNGYFSLSVVPTTVGGPFTLSYSVISSFGNLNINQNTITVTAPIIVPTDKVLQGVTIAGQTGTMPGHGATTASVSTFVSGTTLYTRIPQGAYLINTASGYPEIITSESNLTPGNIKNGVSILGIIGTYSGSSPHGSQGFSNSGIFTVPTGVTQLFCTATGGGGQGGGTGSTRDGGGGGGGGTGVGVLSVTPGQVLNVTVGVGGYGNGPKTNGASGSASSIGTIVGNGGSGGRTPGGSLSGGLGGDGGSGSGFGCPGGNGSSASSNSSGYPGSGGSGSNYAGYGGYGGNRAMGDFGGYPGGNGYVYVAW
ncbi:hypothetical protein [Desulfitobacterium sp. AusDCA]|uniref:hypothetical protein n=1 Tax=Desulfitobacterium sp. AusDCA TaxID=3240383 RepID=UPI003DA75B41